MCLCTTWDSSQVNAITCLHLNQGHVKPNVFAVVLFPKSPCTQLPGHLVYTHLFHAVLRAKSHYDMQAKAVAQHLKEYDIKRVFVSPFYRLVRTSMATVILYSIAPAVM